MSEAALKITGGKPLFGSVRIGGAKNASYKLILAALLADTPSRLLNFSNISDVDTVSEIINQLGGEVKKVGERALYIDPRGLSQSKVPEKYGPQGRFSSMFLPVFLHIFGTGEVPFPGGDKLGKRPLGRHYAALQKLGAQIDQTATSIRGTTSGLQGTTIDFSKNTHTGTETAILAACKAQGKTIIKNAAEEPEVDDLIAFLNSMGANIYRSASREITIEGVESLTGSVYQILPDRNEAVSYACAALATKGDVILENVRAKYLSAFLDALTEVGAGIEVGNYGVRFFYHQPLQATDITTKIHPGFMTDWQPLWGVLMTQCHGTSTIHESVMLKRFDYVSELQSMGANIEYFQPEVDDPASFYNFDLIDDSPDFKHAIRIHGPTQLQAQSNLVATDLRNGATLTIAALTARGTSILRGVEHIDRGYEKLEQRLQALGADIERMA